MTILTVFGDLLFFGDSLFCLELGEFLCLDLDSLLAFSSDFCDCGIGFDVVAVFLACLFCLYFVGIITFELAVMLKSFSSKYVSVAFVSGFFNL